MFNRGGQRRTIETGCGWKCVGHPTEVNKKYLRHRRYCKDCIDNNKVDELPEFNKEGGKINGWKGITIRSQKPNQMLTTAFVEGVRRDIFLDGVKSMNAALSDSRLVAALEAEPTPYLSKSQKKRMKQKAKKEAEKAEVEEPL